MTKQILSTLKSCYGSVQLKLSDYFGEKFNLDRVIYDSFKPQKQSTYANERLLFLEDNRFAMMNPVCPYCDSRKLTKQGFHEINPIMGVFGPQEVKVQIYKCKNCNKKFNTSLEPIVAKNHQYASIFREKTNQIDQNKHRPLRR